MTVYVDDMRSKFGRMIMCHMIADTDTELHDMASKIGVARKWHQAKTSHSHYDIAISKRALAVSLGAREITVRQLACMCANNRAGHGLGDPETAIAVHTERFRACLQ